MNSRQRRRIERIETKFRNDLIDILMQLKREVVSGDFSVAEFCKLVEDDIENIQKDEK